MSYKFFKILKKSNRTNTFLEIPKVCIFMVSIDNELSLIILNTLAAKKISTYTAIRHTPSPH